MAKTKKAYVCQNCGAESPKWVGKCPYCGEWNTYAEEIISKGKAGGALKQMYNNEAVPHKLKDVTSEKKERIKTSVDELDRILGGGVVPGSVILIGGEPGIGKSTLALQFALRASSKKVLYVAGEESEEQIKLRADRLELHSDNCYILCDTLLENIINNIQKVEPDIVIVDSVQTLFKDAIDSSPGSVSQVRECSATLLRVAKESSVPVVLIGHINKEGSLAGPKVLEHIVDTVLQFEGDINHAYRLLRVQKNRFGATSELAIFEMLDKGLKEVLNPSEILINQTDEQLSGISVAATIDGMRPYLIEIQALVSSAVYGTPQRSSTGFDIRRLNMLLAVLEKKAGFKLGSKDVFLNIAGGLKVSDPAVDLSVVCSILSSVSDIPITQKKCFAGEVGLSGEIRPVNRVVQRIKEAEKLGFDKIFISSHHRKNLEGAKHKIEVNYVRKIEELIREIQK